MLVRSFDRFGEIADFSETTGVDQTRFHTASDPDTHGIYSSLGGSTIVLYRAETGLRLWVQGEVIQFDKRTLRLEREAVGRDVVLRVATEQAERTLPYVLPSTISEQLHWVPLSELEDWDYGLFLVEVLADRERQERLFA